MICVIQKQILQMLFKIALSTCDQAFEDWESPKNVATHISLYVHPLYALCRLNLQSDCVIKTSTLTKNKKFFLLYFSGNYPLENYLLCQTNNNCFC